MLLLMTLFFVALFSFYLLLGNYKTKCNTLENYLFANRSVEFLALLSTLVMTEFNTTTLISYTAAGYSAGLRALLLPTVLFICLIFYAVTVAKKWKHYNGISVTHYLEKRYGKSVGYIASTSLMFTMLLFTATYIRSLTLIISPAFPHLNLWWVRSLLILLMLGISLSGGLIAIIRLDIFSLVAVIVFFPVMVLYCYLAPEKYDIHSSLSWDLPLQNLPPEFIFSLAVLASLSYITAPWYGQKILAAKDEKIAYYAVLGAAIILFILYGLGVYATSLLVKKGVLLTQSETALPYIIHNILPTWLSIAAYVIIFLIGATTITSAWNAMVTLLLNSQSYNTSPYSVKAKQWLTLVLALSSLILSNVIANGVFSLMCFTNIPLISLCFAVLAGFYWKKASTAGAFVSMIAGIVYGFACYYIYGDQGNYMWHLATQGIPIIFVFGIMGSYLFPRSSQP